MSNQLAQGGGDKNSDIDEQPDDLTCGKCKMNFTKLNEFCKHKETCNTKPVKPAEDNSSKKIIYKIKMSGAGGRWKTKALEMIQSDPDCFDTDAIGVCNLEKGCLVVWAESSQSDLENADKLKENCIQFTQNMFQKCSLDFTETANINVTVEFSTIFEDSSATKDDDSDSLKCGTCRQEFFTINSFITHRKECARNRKMIKRHQEDISMDSCRFKDGTRALSNVYEDSTRPSTNSSLTGFTKEEINYAKMGMILLNILIDVLYDLLKQDKTFLRPRSECDITYLYKEHRRIDKHTPSIGWGGTWLNIQSTNIAVGDDIERIRNTRNELQHCKTFMLDDKRFNDLYSIIVELLKRFDNHNKPTKLYTNQLNEIVAKTISEEEVKAVEKEISEMIIEVEIEHT